MNSMKIEKYLVLNKYILSLFGADEFKVLQERLKDSREGYDAEGKKSESEWWGLCKEHFGICLAVRDQSQTQNLRENSGIK